MAIVPIGLLLILGGVGFLGLIVFLVMKDRK